MLRRFIVLLIATSACADSKQAERDPVASFEIDERLELCGNVHLPLPEGPQEYLARNVMVTLEAQAHEFAAFGGYRFDDGIPLGPTGHAELLDLAPVIEHPHRQLYGPFSWEPAQAGPNEFLVLEGLNQLLEPEPGVYTLRPRHEVGDPPFAFSLVAERRTQEQPVAFVASYESFQSDAWTMATPGSVLRPCAPGYGVPVEDAWEFDGVSLLTRWESLPRPELELGGGHALLREVAGSIDGVSFSQEDPMQMAARFTLSETGVSAFVTAYTGLDDPDACVIHVQPAVSGPPSLQVMTCDFEVTSSHLLLDS